MVSRRGGGGRRHRAPAVDETGKGDHDMGQETNTQAVRYAEAVADDDMLREDDLRRMRDEYCERRKLSGTVAADAQWADEPFDHWLAGLSAQAEPIHTDEVGLVTAEVQIKAADRAIPAYWARPEGQGPWPTLLVVSEIFAVHEYIRDICRRLAHQGYLAVAPELFVRQGDPRQLGSIPQIMDDIIARVPDEQVQSDLDATAALDVEERAELLRLLKKVYQD